MSNSQIEQIEISIADAKKMIARADALQRLQKNKDFKNVIDEGYLKDEAVRLVHLKAHPNVTPEMMVTIDRDINSVGSLRQHFAVIMMLADRAEQDIQANHEAREEVLAEDLEGIH